MLRGGGGSGQEDVLMLLLGFFYTVSKGFTFCVNLRVLPVLSCFS